jgi:antitoxin component YwqK of YwqJK toxin-antitoxin module
MKAQSSNRSSPGPLSALPRRGVWRWIAPAALLAVAVFLFWMTTDEDVDVPALPEVAQEALEATEDGLREKGSETLFNGFMVTHYPEGGLRSRSQVVDGRLHGVSEGWYPDGQIETREVFVHGVSHGVRVRWHANGEQAVRAEIREGKFHGLYQRWHENGQLAQVIEMVEGEPHGLSEAYFPSGALQARVEMEHGKPIHRQFWNEGEAPVN